MANHESDSDPDDDPDRDLMLLKRHVAQLTEHFDSVHVFATRRQPDGTAQCNWGGGNWYARYGQVREWIIYEEAKAARQAARAVDAAADE